MTRVQVEELEGYFVDTPEPPVSQSTIGELLTHFLEGSNAALNINQLQKDSPIIPALSRLVKGDIDPNYLPPARPFTPLYLDAVAALIESGELALKLVSQQGLAVGFKPHHLLRLGVVQPSRAETLAWGKESKDLEHLMGISTAPAGTALIRRDAASGGTQSVLSRKTRWHGYGLTDPRVAVAVSYERGDQVELITTENIQDYIENPQAPFSNTRLRQHLANLLQQVQEEDPRIVALQGFLHLPYTNLDDFQHPDQQGRKDYAPDPGQLSGRIVNVRPLFNDKGKGPIPFGLLRSPKDMYLSSYLKSREALQLLDHNKKVVKEIKLVSYFQGPTREFSTQATVDVEKGTKISLPTTVPLGKYDFWEIKGPSPLKSYLEARFREYTSQARMAELSGKALNIPDERMYITPVG